MSKTLFTAALAFVLSIGGFVVSAQEEIKLEKDYSLVKLVANSGNVDMGLQESLTKSTSPSGDNVKFGYVQNDGNFVSLVDAMAAAQVVNSDSTKTSTYVLGKFQKNDTFQFGYGNDTSFDAVTPTLRVAGDPLFNAGYNIDSFYQLDFDEDPFNGKIDILVMGEPLPASTVTLLVALAAAAGLLLYNNRRTRARFSAQA